MCNVDPAAGLDTLDEFKLVHSWGPAGDWTQQRAALLLLSRRDLSLVMEALNLYLLCGDLTRSHEVRFLADKFLSNINADRR